MPRAADTPLGGIFASAALFVASCGARTELGIAEPGDAALSPDVAVVVDAATSFDSQRSRNFSSASSTSGSTMAVTLWRRRSSRCGSSHAVGRQPERRLVSRGHDRGWSVLPLKYAGQSILKYAGQSIAGTDADAGLLPSLDAAGLDASPMDGSVPADARCPARATAPARCSPHASPRFLLSLWALP
jgi:hypothetical protein